ncbi:MAG: 1-deoxy-D-xylulose-5-phosphate synthase, partial [Candidatus Izemoplasmatales bacterium]
MIDLLKIDNPAFLKKLSLDELNELADQIRDFLIENVAKTGGHLSSNLGVVELTIALHYVFESPKDRLIFDVGHQGYTHKILTGRAKDFPSLRKINGLSGFLKQQESVHDVWEAGHSSTAMAALAGFEIVRQINHDTYKNVALVGDGSLNSGLSFEALNFLGQRQNLAPIIILNDNEMSISKNVGTISKMLTSMRTTKPYLKATRKGNRIPHFLKNWKERIARMIRGLAKNMTIFDEFGFKYYGPIDGHNLKTLIKYLQIVKFLNKPCVLHIITKKGKGYPFAENDMDGHWHGVKPFNIKTGLPLDGKAENEHSWSNIISEYLCERAKNNPDFRIVIPAMIAGADLYKFQNNYPNQIIDVGICEAFAVCFAGGIAMENKSVFVPVYSSFLQRAYDQVSHDVARQNLHVVFGIDRSGLVGEDGETHQGLYDIAFLRHIPNMQIIQ